MVKITGKILKVCLLIETVRRKTISESVLLYVRYSEVLRNFQVYKYSENFQHLLLSALHESTLLLAYNILSKVKSGRFSWYFCNGKESVTWCRIFLSCFSQSKGDTEKLSSSKKSLPRNTGPIMYFIAQKIAKKEHVFLLSTKQRAWQYCHF